MTESSATGTLSPDHDAAAEHFAAFMDAIGIDLDSEHLAQTPERVAGSRIDELLGGLQVDPREHLRTAFTEDATDELVLVDHIEVASMCAHHFLPFTGCAHVGYIPAERIVGLSKLARVVDGYARRPQVQERLTTQVADAIHEELSPVAVVVVIEATHDCMRLRGVREPNSTTRTSALRGEARSDPEIKGEVLDLLSLSTQQGGDAR
jgi:GTP cyclohydrolase I